MRRSRRISTSILLGALLLPTARLAPAQQVGTPYCFGTGCPCGNDDPGAGCGNAGLDGLPSSGATLVAVGPSTYACVDQVTLYLGGLQPGSTSLVFMGGAADATPFGDGLQCVGPGTVGVYRFAPHTASWLGEVVEDSLVAQSQAFAPPGRISAGSTWYFQGWYRDPAGPCGSGFNLSNGVTVAFSL